MGSTKYWVVSLAIIALYIQVQDASISAHENLSINEVQPKLMMKLVEIGRKTFFAEFASTLTWPKAIANCLSDDMMLADFSEPEKIAVVDRLVELGVTTQTFWIGASNFEEASPFNSYYWLTTNQFAYNLTSTITATLGTLRFTKGVASYYYGSATDLRLSICQKVKSCET